jgi:peptidoglycan/xylan/chitin deacetylase (PgdA/CDA1 family)
VLAEAQPGGIVLMHDVHATTRAALPQIVEGLLTRGYALVTVSELLGTDLTAGTVYRSGPAPTA